MIGALLLLIFGSPAIFTTVNTHHTPFFDRVMFAMTHLGDGNGIIVILAAMLLFKACRNWWYMLAALVCNGLPGLIIWLLKMAFAAPRPLTYFKNAPWIHIKDNWHHLYADSFPSGHSQGIFSLCCFLSLLLPKRFAWVGLILFFISLFVLYTRMYLAAHFYADVYFGSLIGTSTTLFFFALMRRISNQAFPAVQKA